MSEIPTALIVRRCWCGAEDARPLFTARAHGDVPFRYIQCTGCGVVAQDPIPTPEELAPWYAQEYYGESRKKFIGPIANLVGWFQGARARLVESQVRQNNLERRLLDVGCGNGGFLLQMKDKGFTVQGTEWTAESAARVPAEAKIPVHVGDLLSLNLPAESFDVVTLWHVFEHIAAPSETLQAIHRILKPGGLLIMAMPNQESTQSNTFGPHWFHLDPPRHLYGFGPKSLEVILNQTGFIVRNHHTASLEQNPYGWIQSVLNRAGYPREQAYEALKGNRKLTRKQRLIEVARVATLTPFALLLNLFETAAGKGATITIVAQKAKESATP